MCGGTGRIIIVSSEIYELFVQEMNLEKECGYVTNPNIVHWYLVGEWKCFFFYFTRKGHTTS